MTESTVYKTFFKPIFKSAGFDVTRIENGVSVGHPDIQAVYAGVTYYFESKIGRSAGDFVTVKYEPGQEGKIRRLQRVGAPVFILLHWDGVNYILPPAQSWRKTVIADLHDRVVKKYFDFV